MADPQTGKARISLAVYRHTAGACLSFPLGEGPLVPQSNYWQPLSHHPAANGGIGELNGKGAH